MTVIPNSTLIDTVSLSLSNSGFINNKQVHFDVGTYSLDISSTTGGFWIEQTVGTPYLYKNLTETTATVIEVKTAGNYTITLQGGTPNQTESMGIYKIQDLPNSGQNLYQNLFYNDSNADAYSRWNAETKDPGYSAVIFYKFNEVATDASFDNGATAATFTTLSATDRALVEATFASVEAAYDIKFIAIDSSDTSITPNILISGTTNLNGSTAGYADFAQATGGAGALTLLVDTAIPATDVAISEAVLVHELGHALGLKHPFSSGGPLPALAGTQEAADYDNKYFSIMSYTRVGQKFDEYREFDIDALTYLYGKNGDSAVTHVYDSVKDIVTFTGSSGDDKIAGSSIDDIINANDGADIVYGSSGNDEIYGGEGNDLLSGGRGADKIYGGAGNDTLLYTRSVNSDTALVDIDLYDGGSGDDTLDASGYNVNVIIDLSSVSNFVSIENLIGTNNPVNINPYADYLYGDAFDNKIYGLKGNDNLKGNAGSDALYGGADDDQLDGGTGSDYLNGGIGTDTAVYQGNESSYTRATDVFGQTTVTLNSSGEFDTLVNIEFVKFFDNTVAISSNINSTPVASAAGNLSTTGNLILLPETSIYKMAEYFNDVDGDSLTYSASGLPNGLTISSATGVINGQMSAADAANNVTVTANDGNGSSASINFSWAVTGGSPTTNNAPTATTINAATITENTTISAGLSTYKMADYFNDADGDTLTYSATNLPAGLVINSTSGVISGTLTAAAGNYSAVISVNDGAGGTATSNFNWVVEAGAPTVNNAPVASTITDVSVKNGLTFAADNQNFNMSNYFSDADGDTLTYSASGLPNGMSIDATSGIIFGQLTGNVGTYDIIITAADGNGGTAQATASWSVVTNTSNTNVNDVVLNPLGIPLYNGLAGHDQLVTLAGLSTLDGGDGNDFIMGGFEADRLYGGADNDILRGDASDIIGGSDYLRGDKGNDILMGGMGSDTFFFSSNDGNDVITGFKTNQVSFDASTGYAVQPNSTDFETGIDHIMLAGFNDLTAANILSFLSDGADGAVWQHEGTSITFYGVNANQLDAGDFLI